MRLGVVLIVVSALFLTSAALAEQVGGPSGPEQGQVNVGAEGVLRTNIHGIRTSWLGAGLDDWKSRTFYGVLEYGITDCLSIRGKAGMAEWEEDEPANVGRVKFGYGFAWAAGIKWRICHPEDGGTALALSAQYAKSEPDNWTPGGLILPYQNAETTEWTAALTVGVPHGSTRPYAGVVYSDLEMDWQLGPPAPPIPFAFDRQKDIGVVVGLDHDLGNVGFFNIEARIFDEEGIAGSANFTF